VYFARLLSGLTPNQLDWKAPRPFFSFLHRFSFLVGLFFPFHYSYLIPFPRYFFLFFEGSPFPLKGVRPLPNSFPPLQRIRARFHPSRSCPHEAQSFPPQFLSYFPELVPQSFFSSTGIFSQPPAHRPSPPERSLFPHCR